MVAEAEAHHDGESLDRRAARSFGWVVLGFSSAIVLRIVSSVILTRFIHPEIYGMMDLVTTLIVALHLFSDIGIVPCIVQSPRGGEPRYLNTLWTMQLARNAIILCVAAVVAFPISRVYGKPIIAWVLPAIGITGLLECLQSTGVFVLNRQVRRGRLVTMELLSSVVTLMATVIAIYVWDPVGCREVLSGRIASLPFDESLIWTVVVGAIAGRFVWVGLSYLLTPGRLPRFDWQKDAVREVFGFGRWVFFSTILQFLAQQTDRLIAPKVSDFEANGLYGRGLGLAAMGTSLVENLASSIVFPTISRAVERGSDPISYAKRVALISRLVSATLLTGLFVAGPSIVRVLYPETYSDVGFIVQALAVVGWFQCQSIVVGSILLGVGKPAGMMVANGSKLLVLVLLVVPAAYLAKRYDVGGIMALILVVGIGETVRYLSYVTIARRMRLWRPWADVGAFMIMAAFAAAALGSGRWLTHQALSGLPHSRLDWVISMMVHGGIVLFLYGVVAFALWRLGQLKLAE